MLRQETPIDPHREILPNGLPRLEYFVVQPGLTGGDGVYIRLHREEPGAGSWHYDFLDAKSRTPGKTVAYLTCERSLIRSLAPDKKGKARAAFQGFTA